ALLGRAPDLEVHEVLDHLVGPVLLDLLGHLPVILVALGLREVVVLEVVVVEDGLVVATDVAAGHLVRARRVLVAERPAGAPGRRRGPGPGSTARPRCCRASRLLRRRASGRATGAPRPSSRARPAGSGPPCR